MGSLTTESQAASGLVGAVLSCEFLVGPSRASLSYMVLTVGYELLVTSYEMDSCRFPMGVPAELSMNHLAQASFDRRCGMSFRNVISEC
jgi:hypothetical protein